MHGDTAIPAGEMTRGSRPRREVGRQGIAALVEG